MNVLVILSAMPLGGASHCKWGEHDIHFRCHKGVAGLRSLPAHVIVMSADLSLEQERRIIERAHSGSLTGPAGEKVRIFREVGEYDARDGYKWKPASADSLALWNFHLRPNLAPMDNWHTRKDSSVQSKDNQGLDKSDGAALRDSNSQVPSDRACGSDDASRSGAQRGVQPGDSVDDDEAKH